MTNQPLTASDKETNEVVAFPEDPTADFHEVRPALSAPPSYRNEVLCTTSTPSSGPATIRGALPFLPFFLPFSDETPFTSMHLLSQVLLRWRSYRYLHHQRMPVFNLHPLRTLVLIISLTGSEACERFRRLPFPSLSSPALH
jgi:hypothetical protein